MYMLVRLVLIAFVLTFGLVVLAFVLENQQSSTLQLFGTSASYLDTHRDFAARGHADRPHYRLDQVSRFYEKNATPIRSYVYTLINFKQFNGAMSTFGAVTIRLW